MLFGIIATILGALGVFGFFSNNMTLIIIGGVTGLAVNILGLLSGQQKSILTASIAVIVGIVYSSIVGLSFWIGAFIGLSFCTTVTSIAGWVMISMSKKK